MISFTRTEAFFDSLFSTAGNILLAFIRRLAPFAVPLSPAFFLSHAIARSVYTLTQSWSLAWAVGIVAALGLESAGILGAHLSVRFYARQDTRWQVAAAGTAAYLFIGITTIWLLDSTTNDAKMVGTAMFAIAGIVYTLVGLEESDRVHETAVSQASAQQQQAAEREWQRQRELAAATRQQQQALELARIAADERIELAKIEARAKARASTVPAQASIRASTASLVCQHCGAQAGKSGQPFRSVQALNAHMAHCPAKETT